jgi:hypothetical protein
LAFVLALLLLLIANLPELDAAEEALGEVVIVSALEKDLVPLGDGSGASCLA